MPTYTAYATGTVTATNGSPTITGSGTTWTDANIPAGSKLEIAGVEYTVLTRDSATQLTLTANYAESTGSGKAYKVTHVMNPTPLTANEAVTVDGGITLHITTGAWSANGAGSVTLTWGTLFIENTSTSAGIKFIGNTTGSSISINPRATFKVRGARIAIKTSDGTASQTATLWDGAYCPCLWVETGNGTNVFVKYLNISGGQAAHTTNMTYLGNTEPWGRFYSQSGATVTFGDGTNGVIPPNGARIMQPNIIFTHIAAETTSYPAISTNAVYGRIDIDTAQLSRYTINFGGSSYCDVQRCGFSVVMQPNSYTDGVTFNDCGYSPTIVETSNSAVMFGSLSYIYNLTITDCAGWTGGSAAVVGTGSNNTLTINGGCFMYVNNNTTLATAIFNFGVSDLVSMDGTYICGRLIFANNFTLNNITVQTRINGADDISIGAGIITLGGSTTQKIGSFKITGMTINGGFGTGGYVMISTGVPVENGIMANVTASSTRWSSVIYSVAGFSNVVLADWNIGGSTGGWFSQPWNFSKQVTIQNFNMPGYSSGAISLPMGGVFTYKGIAGSAASFTGTTGKDNFIVEKYTSDTEGELFIRGCIKATASYVEGSGVFFDTTGIYLPNVNDYATITWPHKILGVSSFRNLEATPNGTNTGNFTFDYQIDTGSGWSAWKSLTGANLSGETVSASSGFYFKVRLTCNTTNATNKINYLRIYTNIDRTVKYPINLVNLKLENVVTGSSYRISRTSDDSVIAFGTASASTVNITNIPYSSDVGVTIRVRKAGYLPFETGGTITATGMSTFVSQTADSVYQA